MRKLRDLLSSFEIDDDGWFYYGSIDPKEALAELDELEAQLPLPFTSPDPEPLTRGEVLGE